jgi:predicted carbohydrate-binding protein with CBM48
MSDSERDPVVRRAIEELRRLPSVDRDAVQRVVTAAAAVRVAPAIDEPVVPLEGPRRMRVSILIGVAAAAAFVGFAIRGAWPHAPAPQQTATFAPTGDAAVPAAAELRTVASSPNDALPVPQQFVIHSTTAHRVSVVGDFNRWNPESAPMTRSSNGALWSVTIPILPGRHMYGFIVDDSTFILDPDPRFPKARDADLGVEGSVVIVGRP